MIAYRSKQYLKLFGAAVLAVGSIVLIQICFDPEPILIGSMIGALPLALFELDNRIKQPHVVCTDVEVVKYPKRWFSFERSVTGRGLNAVCVRAEIQNDGFQTAEDCSVQVAFGDDPNDAYSTRWNRGSNPVELSLSQDESQKVDLFWIRLGDETILTAVAEDGGDQSGSYPKAARYELSPGQYRIKMAVSAANMAEQDFEVSVGSTNIPNLPEEVLELAEEADVVKSVKQEERYAVHYYTAGGHVMQIPDGMDISDLTEFDVIEETQDGRPFAAYARERYDIQRL
jgi:hypothetical protein